MFDSMTIYEILKKYWNYDSFRPLQEDIIQSVLEKKDSLALMPTGGGKSICFQVPALLQPGICIVVSPLIALMKDQVENLKARGLEAVSIVSGMSRREIDILLDNCIYGKIKFLYLSPERLLSSIVKERISHMNVNLIAVDEAHCISQWGYDFRPPYLRIPELRELHPLVPILALTATATVRVIEDIQNKLAFRAHQVFSKSFKRNNLSYVVSYEENKIRKLLSVARNIEGTGIVYVRNRRQTQEISNILTSAGIESDYYHAGLDTPERSLKQQAWMKNQKRVIVATNAFGMGIDKPDVRFVVHMDIPESMEAYYQEAGRAGRDDKKSYAVMLYHVSDRDLLEKRLKLSFPTVPEIRNVYQCLGNYYQIAHGSGEGLVLEFDIGDFCSRYKLDAIKAINALKYLEHDEYLAVTESVYLPSRVQIIVPPEDLYRFQIQNAFYDSFIKILLRSYGGMFDTYTAIQEYDVAKRLGKTRQEVADILNKLQDYKLISYLPQTDKPQLQFLKARVATDNMHLDVKYMNERKVIMEEQIQSILHYAESKICRNIMLLHYFNELNAAKCGICDVCIEEKRRANSAGLTDRITYELIDVLAGQHLNLEDLISSLQSGNEKERIEVLRNLMDAGKVKTDGDKYYL